MTQDERDLVELKFLKKIVVRLDENLQEEMESGSLSDGAYGSAYRKRQLSLRLNALSSQVTEIDRRIAAKVETIQTQGTMQYTQKSTEQHYFEFI